MVPEHGRDHLEFSEITLDRPTIGVVTTVGTYEHFLTEWCTSVRGLERQPDKVVIAAHRPDKVKAITDKELPQATIVSVTEEFSLGHYLNQAIAACGTDWITWIGADDRYWPQALNGLDIVDADVYIYGMRIGIGGQWHGGNLEEALSYNPAPCGSPFRRWIWESIPFQTDLAPFEDWAFWVGAHLLGATAKRTSRIDFDYRIHPGQIVPPLEPTATRIKEWAARVKDGKTATNFGNLDPDMEQV